MSSTAQFRRRIKSINNTKQITRAMQMISSIKMQKATKKIQDSRAYIQNAWNILAKLTKMSLPSDHLLLSSPVKATKIAVILVSSDRTLCGSYNSDIFKRYLRFIKENISQGKAIENVDVIAIGKRGADFVKKNNLGNIIAEFNGFENGVNFDQIIPISKLSNDEYLNKKYKKVVAIYSHFESLISHLPVAKQILPIVDSHIDEARLWQDTDQSKADYTYEPDAILIIETILSQIVRTQIYGAILEGNASEQSARMLAMQNATDNAQNLIKELTLLYNTVRQNSITAEISEIANAAEAMK